MTIATLIALALAVGGTLGIVWGCHKAVKNYFGGLGKTVVMVGGSLVCAIMFFLLNGYCTKYIARSRNAYPAGMTAEEVIAYPDLDKFYDVVARKYRAVRIDGYLMDYPDDDGDWIPDFIERDEGSTVGKKTVYIHRTGFFLVFRTNLVSTNVLQPGVRSTGPVNVDDL